MKVLMFIAADCSNISKEGKLNIMGIFHEINAFSFPARHPSMHLVLSLGAELGEYGSKRELVIKMQSANGNELLNLQGPIEIPQAKEGKRPEVNAIFELNEVTFPEPGPYQFIVMIDKDYKGDMSIHVNKIEGTDNLSKNK